MRMIRKQLYITGSQQHKLHRLAAHRNCTEAEIVRAALDALPDPEGAIEDRLLAAGVLVPAPEDPDLPTGPEGWAEDQRLEIELDAWLAALGRPLGLSEAVIADRR